MVTRSIDNYEQHKKDIYKIVLEKHGKTKADKFINQYSDRYDRFGRSFIDYRLAVNLMQDIKHVNRVGTRIFGAVGVGGTGKSTFMKNVLYWLDGDFSNKYVNMDVKEFIKILKKLPIRDSMRSNMLDEPETEIHPTSVVGKKLRKIAGKWRQQKLFIGLCATDLTDIPPYLFKKIEVLFFVPYWGVAYMVRNLPKLKSYPVQKIRMSYMQGNKGYNVFYDLKRKRTKGFYQIKTMSVSCVDIIDGKEYIKRKSDDYLNDINSAISSMQPQKDSKPKLDKRDEMIIKWQKDGLKQAKMAERAGVTVRQIQNIVARIRNADGC